MYQRSRALSAWIAVMAVTAGGLKALDHVPTFVAGTTHDARVFRSLDDAERAVGARLWLPAYYPEQLGWPPRRIEASATSPTTVVLFGARGEGRHELVVSQSIGAIVGPPPALLRPARAMETTEVPLGGHKAVLVRALLGTVELHDLSWDQGGRRLTLRYSGPTETLLQIGGSLERRAAERLGER